MKQMIIIHTTDHKNFLKLKRDESILKRSIGLDVLVLENIEEQLKSAPCKQHPLGDVYIIFITNHT